ncbi:MAG: hypothetical protein M0002_15595 [Rhodospirillales bacterium]|nr:hypothetical protein [Rhodospirillales bacterium]
MAERPSGAAAGFLTMAFVIVGLAGLLATYAAPVPSARALRREAVLDRVVAAAAMPDAAAHLAALRPELGRSAAAVLAGPGTLEERVARERAILRARSEAESAALAARLRLLIGIATLAGTIIGIAMLGIGRRKS